MQGDCAKYISEAHTKGERK